MPWLSKKRIAYAAGNSSARPGAVDQSAEVSGTRKWRRKRREKPCSSRYSASDCVSSSGRAVRSQRPISHMSPTNPGLARFAGCANGRRPEYSRPQPEQLTEKDMSDSCVATPNSRKRRPSSG